MATYDQLKELFKNQEEREDMRREKEKEVEERKRKADKEEVKEVINTHMSSIKEDMKEIKIKQDQMEGQVIQSEARMEKKYDDMANKFGNLEKKMKELENREKDKESLNIDSSKTWPTIQPEGRMQSSSQPTHHPAGRVQTSYQPSIHPVGKVHSSIQQASQGAGSIESNNKIYSVVRKARRTVGFSPITSENIKEVMEDTKAESMEAGLKEVVKDFLRGEMAMPEEVINQLEFEKIFRRDGGSEDDKIFVEFTEDNMPGIIYKFVRKLRKECNIITFIPDAFRERAAVIEKIAFEMRHSTPPYSTKVRWGWGDLILERKLRGSRESYRSVNMYDLPPVDLTATPRVRLAVASPTTSPAPGRQARKKRVRSEESPNLSPDPKTSRQEDNTEKTNDMEPRSAPALSRDVGFFSPMNFVTPKGSSLPSQISQPDFQ